MINTGFLIKNKHKQKAIVILFNFPHTADNLIGFVKMSNFTILSSYFR